MSMTNESKWAARVSNVTPFEVLMVFVSDIHIISGSAERAQAACLKSAESYDDMIHKFRNAAGMKQGISNCEHGKLTSTSGIACV